jgi:hypothetical protein
MEYWKKKNELQLFLNNQKLDICLIPEIHLTNQNYITFNDYIVYMKPILLIHKEEVVLS